MRLQWTEMFINSKWYLELSCYANLNQFDILKKIPSFLQLVIENMCFCPSDCETTKYIIEYSTSPRSLNDTTLLIRSYSKKNKILYNVGKQIKNLYHQCITPDVKEQKVLEFKQLNRSIAYSCSLLHFFWNSDTIVSYKRDQRYTIIDMLGK